jgi:hypothetical protein
VVTLGPTAQATLVPLKEGFLQEAQNKVTLWITLVSESKNINISQEQSEGKFRHILLFRTVFSAPFLFLFFLGKKFFKNFTIKAKSFVRSVPLMLNLSLVGQWPPMLHHKNEEKKNLTKNHLNLAILFPPEKWRRFSLSPKNRINFLLFIFLAKFRHAPPSNFFY